MIRVGAVAELLLAPLTWDGLRTAYDETDTDVSGLVAMADAIEDPARAVAVLVAAHDAQREVETVVLAMAQRRRAES